MTRKDYELIADALRDGYESWPSRTIPLPVEKLMERLEEDNPRFDRERFLDAAGFTERLP